ncbi:LacI family DNA-binding transcriptional regulator [Ancrocorticia populi]|uniref:LacI family DNA-binding transcriptional regulator n=1 Tax=Ancrocorticia populi TaxID=2175228 RepID=UPI002357DA2A|nr:LacI family DNA-binding transcriptional regulator [Ancrocorticia populi]
MTANGRPTILDVARVAGLSHATVSRYLNKRAYVSEDAAQAIEQAIKAVNYMPSRTARSLVNRQTHAVAFVVRERPDLFFADPNLSNMAIGANTVLSEQNYQMLFLIIDSEQSASRITELIGGGFVDGVILVAMSLNDPVAQAIADTATPAVTASVPLPNSSVPYVDTDNEGGTRKVTQLFMRNGRKKIAYLGGPQDEPATALRHQGYRSALGDSYNPALVAYADAWELEAGTVATQRLLDTEPHLDAVIAASDLLATASLDVLTSRGLRVPEDVALSGFDDSTWAVRAQPPLTTVRQDSYATGEEMARIILRQIDGEDLQGFGHIIPNEIIWRESSDPPSDAS